MDPIDQLHLDQDNAEKGIDLKERPAIPPEFLAGNQLSDALEVAEAQLGPNITGLILQLMLAGKPCHHASPAFAPLQAAIEKFRVNVSPAVFRERLQNRINRLLRPA